jgi:hypothetical protein
MSFNLPNIMAIYGKLNDLIVILLVAFSNNVKWIPGKEKFKEEDMLPY